MSETQYNALTERQHKSVNIQQELEDINYKTIKQRGEIVPITNLISDIDPINLSLPPELKIPKLVETENYFFVYNVILSPSESNIAKYDKQGKFLNLFARKGRGPNEITKIDALNEKDNLLYVSNNGSIKIFNKEDEETDIKFLNIWAYDIHINKNDYDIRSPANRVFTFPVLTLDLKTDSVKFTISDPRKDVFNFKSSNNTTFYSNDTLIIYAKTPSNKIHFFSKKRKKFFEHYKIDSEIIRRNTETLTKNPTQNEFFKFYNALFLIDKIYLNNEILWITFIDHKDKETHYYIGKVSLKNGTANNILPLKLYETSNLFKNVHFWGNHLYFYKRTKNDTEINIYKILLSNL